MLSWPMTIVVVVAITMWWCVALDFFPLSKLWRPRGEAEFSALVILHLLNEDALDALVTSDTTILENGGVVFRGKRIYLGMYYEHLIGIAYSRYKQREQECLISEWSDTLVITRAPASSSEPGIWKKKTPSAGVGTEAALEDDHG